MGRSAGEDGADEYYAMTYDESVPDWPGEMDFYQGLAAEAREAGGAVLELACGTGRVAVRLAQQGASMVGLDLSPVMLAMARAKGAGLANLRLVQADMRSFELGETFGLVLIPAHSFQNLTTPRDQVACLECIGRHLGSGARLVMHLDPPDVPWLGGLCGEKRGVFEATGEFAHPETRRPVRASQAWTYEPATQTATVRTVWDELGPEGEVVRRVERSPVRLHCAFPFEVEHLLARTGFVVEAVYGDFFRRDMRDDSPDMIWVARRG